MHVLEADKSLTFPALFLVFISCWTTCASQTYDDGRAIINDKLNSSVYLTDVRPKNDLSQSHSVDVSFELISIVKIDDVSQTFTCNGFVTASWVDERIAWDPSDYGGILRIFPATQKIWKPRMVLFNTLDERDLFEDDHAPTFIFSNGTVFWAPGSVFPTSCELNMAKYPFDEQTCSIEFICMNYDVHEVLFVSSKGVGTKFYVPHGEWELLGASVEASQLVFDQNPTAIPSVTISFHVKRRPVTFLLNIMLPVVFLSVLNILVFLIPVESGEKIGYGITVLLALSVFLSIVSSMLPSSSGTVPHVTIYLFCLLVVSVLTVVDTIIIVFLHNLEEKEDICMKATDNYQRALRKVKNVNKINPLSSVNALKKKKESEENDQTLKDTASIKSPFSKDPLTAFMDPESAKDGGEDCKGPEKPKVNKYRVIGKYIDMVSLIAFSVVWVALTMGFLIKVTT